VVRNLIPLVARWSKRASAALAAVPMRRSQMPSAMGGRYAVNSSSYLVM